MIVIYALEETRRTRETVIRIARGFALEMDSMTTAVSATDITSLV